MTQRPRRSESYVGIHFDFHAQDDPTVAVGANTTPEAIQKVIDNIHPDYIEFDCKGHPGLSSYPTKIGNPAPNIVGDPLRVVRNVTADNGVALYVHYSGIWDTYAIGRHPEWALIHADGTPDPDATSMHSSYVDDLMLPQLRELALQYEIDGAWIDGDCWMVELDYHPAALQEFQDQYGLSTAPTTPEDPGWDDFRAYTRESYRRYLRHYVDAIHSFAPNFDVGVNWTFTEFMPEPVTANVDFLSGDAHIGGGHLTRIAGRHIAKQAMPWDLMSWGHSGTWPDTGTNTTKSSTQLKQEAATVLALGGGYQAVFNQKKDGTIIQWGMPVMGDVAEFCRERQPFSQNAELLSDIAVISSSTDTYSRARTDVRLFRANADREASMRGAINLLVETQHTVDVVVEELLLHQVDRYQAVVLPETNTLDEGTLPKLLQYAENGGALLVLGTTAAQLVASRLGFSSTITGDDDSAFFVEIDGMAWGIQGGRLGIDIGDTAVDKICRIFPSNDLVGASEPAALAVKHGQGTVAIVPFNIGSHYEAVETSRCRQFMRRVLAVAMPSPTATVTGSDLVDVVLARKDGALHLHLISTAGPYRDRRVWVFDEIPAVGPLTCTVQTGKPPNRVTLEPGNRPVDYTFDQGSIQVVVPKINIYEIVRID